MHPYRGGGHSSSSPPGSANGHGGGGPPEKRRRRRRWEPVDERAVEVQNLRGRLNRISSAIATGQIPVDDLCRSPSPPPRYDARGKRVNTRYERARQKLEDERFKLVTRLREIDPQFRPPVGMRPPKIQEKLMIPKEKEGTVNFIGLILGPRGKTQKRLEKEFQCRVAIRGKGSVKDGRARAPSHDQNLDEQLHVLITAEGLDAAERIDKCKQRILEIIKPRPDELNAHKQAQLRELAQLNGTLRDSDRDRFDFAAGGRPQQVSQVSNELEGDFQSLIGAIGGDPAAVAPSAAPSAAAGATAHAAPAAADGYPWLAPGAFATRPHPPPSQVALPHPGHVVPSRRFSAAAPPPAAARYAPPVPGAPSWMSARPAAHPSYNAMPPPPPPPQEQPFAVAGAPSPPPPPPPPPDTMPPPPPPPR